MIIDKFVKVKLNNKTKKYYLDKGYEIIDDSFYVNIKDLSHGSSIKVNCVCDICNKEVIISYKLYNRSFKIGNKFCCSRKCSNIKARETNIIKYGYDNPSKNDSVKDKIKITNKEKYGGHPSLNDDVKNKRKFTLISKYNTEHFFNSDIFKRKKKDTNIIKYGTENYTNRRKFKETFNKLDLKDIINKRNSKIEDRLLLKYSNRLNNNYKILNYDITTKTFNIKHLLCKHSFTINRQLLFDRLSINSEICIKCNPINSNITSYQETQIKEFLDSLDIKYHQNNRTILNGKELDIYISEYNLSIEFNGLYWHSELHKDKNYHKNKSLQCKEKGIHLLHIWEDDWKYKKDIIKSNIKSLLNKNMVIKEKDCILRKVDTIDRKTFLHFNHIENDICSDSYGYYYNNELVFLICYINKNIVRMCNKIGYYFCYDINNKTIIENFSTTIIKSNNFYKITEPNIMYVSNNVRYKNSNKKSYKIYDSGNIIFKNKY